MKNKTIYDFKDPILFLENCFQDEKLIDPDLSLRKWDAKIGLNSADTLFKVMSKSKNLSSTMIKKFSEALKLDSSEERYFEAMAMYVQAKTSNEKNIYELVLAELAGLKGKIVYLQDDGLFSHWSNLTLLAFCNLAGGCNRANIRELLVDDLPEEVIDESIDRLLRLGLITIGENGSFKRVFNHETTKNDLPRPHARKYYEQVFDLAKSRIDLQVDEREFQCSLMSIKRDQLPLAKDLIRTFKAKMSELSGNEDGEQVFQLNIQFFPMSRRIDNGNSIKINQFPSNHQSTSLDSL